MAKEIKVIIGDSPDGSCKVNVMSISNGTETFYSYFVGKTNEALAVSDVLRQADEAKWERADIVAQPLGDGYYIDIEQI